MQVLGMTLRKTTEGEFRVNFKGGVEDTAHYASDLNDAVDTGRRMVRDRARLSIAPLKRFDVSLSNVGDLNDESIKWFIVYAPNAAAAEALAQQTMEYEAMEMDDAEVAEQGCEEEDKQARETGAAVVYDRKDLNTGDM